MIDFLLIVSGALFAMFVSGIVNYKKTAWVKLTDEEIESAWRQSCTIDNGKGANLTNQPFYHLSKLIEAKLIERNT